MVSRVMKNAASNLGLFLAFGLLAGTLLENPARGVLAGLLCHLLVSVFSRRSDEEREVG